ncbi:MAG: polyketide cyclase [Rhodanobacter sp.]
MMRVLEFLVALLIVAGLGAIAGIASPGSGHIDRSLVIGKDLRQVYDVLDNYRRLPDFSVLREDDPRVQFKFAGKSYGPGAEVSWTSEDPKVGNGQLTIASATPDFDKIDDNTKDASIVWNLDNKWRGQDKHFTLDLERQGSRGQLTKVNWSYDVTYGWNLVNRFANLYIHGEPDELIQYGLANLQNVLASVPNIDYSQLIPYIEQSQPVPVLMLATSSPRDSGIQGLDEVVAAAITELQASAKKLNVSVTGPRILFTTNYGDQLYTFDVALPISASSLNVGGNEVQLTASTPVSADATGSAAATADAKDALLKPGSLDRYGRLIIDSKVRAEMAFGSAVLKGVWNGTFAGVPQTRDMLKAYATTHGYKFDEVINRPYNILVRPEVQSADGDITTYAQYAVYLPITDAPAQTPEQEAGIPVPSLEAAAPAPAASAADAPAAATSAAEPAEAASVGQ